jgi:dTMP kinase
MTGLLIAFEGADGAGKSTLSRAVFELLIAEELRLVVLTHEPWQKGKFKRLRKAGEATLEAYEQDRREHWREVIYPSLECGAIVLTDRYFLSTAVYQASLGGWTWGALVNRQRCMFAEPDLWVICVAATAAQRLASREPPEEYSAEVERKYGMARHAIGNRSITVDCSDPRHLAHNASRVAWEILRLRG